MPSRPCWVEISARAFENNYRVLQAVAPRPGELLAVVKANAYGHGLEICAPAAMRAGAQWLGVTSVEEAVAARAVCPSAHILVMGGVFPGQYSSVIQQSLTPVVWDPSQIQGLEAAAREVRAASGTIPVHLEVDTGMSRQGVSPEMLDPTLACFHPASPLRVEAVMTHLYASDESGGSSSRDQLECLEQALVRIVPALSPKWLSVGASAALMGKDALEAAAMAARWNLQLMVRPGLSIYGLVPRFHPPYSTASEPPALVEARRQLQPVLAWKTRIVSIRTIAPGTEVGYNETFVATEPMKLALIPAGYADGLDRRLGNRFSLLVRGEHAPLVGRVSMDQAVLDVTDIGQAAAGDEVVILGTQGAESITAFDHADAAETIPWEVFTRIGARVPRIQV